MIETIGTMIAGVGLFFSGVKIVGSSMKKLTSRRFRIMVSKWTKNPLLGSFWGFLSGAISQSSSNTAFILAGLISSGLVKVRNALPIVAWSNVGTTLLIFLVAINMKFGILILLGISGIFFGFSKEHQRERLFYALFGVGILLFGFHLLKSGSKPLADLEELRALFAYAKNSYIIPFILGAALRFLIQSSSTVTVLIMTISHAGLIGLDQIILMIYGMSVGEGSAVLLLSSNIKGSAKKITLYKVFEGFAGSLIMVVLFIVEAVFHIPLVRFALTQINGHVEQQAANAFLATKLVPTLVFSLMFDQIYKLLDKFSPPTPEESLSKPKYINDYALRDPETAMTLAEKEQLRIMKRFPLYLDTIREEVPANKKLDKTLLRKSSSELLAEIREFLKQALDSDISHESSERLLNIQNRQNQIEALDENIYLLVESIDNLSADSNILSSLEIFVEGLHANLHQMIDAAVSNDEFDADMLLNITADRGPLMEKIRKSYLSGDKQLSPEERGALLYVTDLFQRIIWLANNWAKFFAVSIRNN